MSVPFLSVKPRAIKLKVSPRFPAQLIGRAGINVAKQNGNYYLDLDYTDFPVIGSVPAGTTYALIFDPVTGLYRQLPISLLGGGGGGGGGGTPSDAAPIMDGIAAPGVSLLYSRGDHVHPTDTTRAAASAIRERLTGPRTYYVSTTGSDANNGLTAGTPFRTLQRAYDVIVQTLDLGGQTVTIQTTNATFAEININSAWVGGGNIILDLAGGTIQCSNASTCLNCSVPLPGVFTIRNCTLTTSTTSGYLISHGGTGLINVGDVTMNGGASIGYDMVAAYANAYVRFVGNIIFGTCSNWREIFYAHAGGLIDLYGAFGQTMTMTGNMSWSDSFAYADVCGGAIQAVASARTINTGGFTMTGKRYTAAPGGAINTNGGGVNYFPGSIAGSPSTITASGAYS